MKYCLLRSYIPAYTEAMQGLFLLLVGWFGGSSALERATLLRGKENCFSLSFAPTRKHISYSRLRRYCTHRTRLHEIPKQIEAKEFNFEKAHAVCTVLHVCSRCAFNPNLFPLAYISSLMCANRTTSQECTVLLSAYTVCVCWRDPSSPPKVTGGGAFGLEERQEEEEEMHFRSSSAAAGASRDTVAVRNLSQVCTFAPNQALLPPWDLADKHLSLFLARFAFE